MRPDDALLLDMLTSARKIVRYSDGVTRTAFDENDMLQSAVIREFQIIGEAARAVTDETKDRYPELPWRMIIGMRNRVIHEYFNLDRAILWDTIQINVPELIPVLERIVGE